MYEIEVVTRKRTWKDLFIRPQLHHWRIWHHGHIIASSETYYNLNDCTKVAENLHKSIPKSILNICGLA